MTHAEQKELIRELLDSSRRMSREEEEEFRMFVKRDKDDEDLDRISQRRLQELYEKYVVHRRPR
jgi:hypothetical protein